MGWNHDDNGTPNDIPRHEWPYWRVLLRCINSMYLVSEREGTLLLRVT